MTRNLLLALTGVAALFVVAAMLVVFALRERAPDPAAFTEAAAARAGETRVAAFFTPDPPRQTGNTVWLYLTRDGEPVTNAAVGVEAMMPEMGAMPEMRSRADMTDHGGGIWSAAFDLEMGGGWTLEATVDDKMARLQFTVGSRGLIGEESSTAPPPPAEIDLPALEMAPDAVGRLRQALLLTDDVRERLATDTLDGVSPLVADLQTQLAVEVPEPAAAWVVMAREASRSLGAATDLKEARARYAELMRALIAVASANDQLTDGFHVFSCPMTEGFGKWVQVGAELHNPYMGKSMPGCGTTASWTSIGPGPGANHDDAAVIIEARRLQQFGIRTTPVARETVFKNIRALGLVAWADGGVEDVTLTTGGWVRKLRVNAEGVKVVRGQVLFELYSPELYAAQQEYLLAAERPSGDPLREASRHKLLLMGLVASQLDQLAARGEPWEQVPIQSPVSGYVVDKNVVEGTAFSAGAPLFRIAPLGTVWVEAEVYAEDVPFVEVGTPATVTLPNLPGGVYLGAVSQLLPRVSPVQHTRTARLVLDNPDERLLPGMYTDVRLEVPLEARLIVPETAVIYTGTRRIVFVDAGGGRLVPREIELGPHVDSGWVVDRGLVEGERVVTTGTFLVAAESRMRAATDLWEQE